MKYKYRLPEGSSFQRLLRIVKLIRRVSTTILLGYVISILLRFAKSTRGHFIDSFLVEDRD